MDIDSRILLNDHGDARNIIKEVFNAEKQLWTLVHSKGLLHPDVHQLYRRARSCYEKVILNEYELSELQNIEFSLWKLHYKYIDEYRNKIRKSVGNVERTSLEVQKNLTNDYRMDGLISFLLEATEFYEELIMKIKRSFGIPNEALFFRKGSFPSEIESEKKYRCQFLCHRCSVCLGDLARYRELYAKSDVKTRNWSIAATHYLNASVIWPDGGNPQNQLALLAIYVDDELLALYHCVRSLSVKEPFPDAWDNLTLLFEKNRSSHLHSLSTEATFDFFQPFERGIAQTKAQLNNNSSNCNMRKATEDAGWSGKSGLWSLIVRTISIFFVNSSSDDFPYTFASTMNELEALMSLDDVRLKAALESYQHLDASRRGPFRALQIVSVLIFTIHTLSEKPKEQERKDIKDMQQPDLIQLALVLTFICVGRLINRCMGADSFHHRTLLPSLLVFVEWLVEVLYIVERYKDNEKCASAIGYFFSAFVDLLNRFDDQGSEVNSQQCIALWEDHELWGFAPLAHAHASLDFSTHGEQRIGLEERNECQVRICRIRHAAMKIVSRSTETPKWIFYEQKGGKFYVESKEIPDRRELEAVESTSCLLVTELEQHLSVPENALSDCKAAKECRKLDEEGNRNSLQVHEKSAPTEDEEVILFKPIMRYNSVPLDKLMAQTSQILLEDTQESTSSSDECLRRSFSLANAQNQVHGGLPSFHSKINGSSFNKTMKQDTPGKDSVTYPYSETTISAGPPSLNAWVLNGQSSSISGENGPKGSSKLRTGHSEELASAYMSGLSMSGTAISQENSKVTTASGSPCLSQPVLEENFVTGPWYTAATTHLSAPPYLSPVPSAPLLPDDALWFTGDSPNYVEHKDTEGMKSIKNLGASRINSYSNWTDTRGLNSFDAGVSGFSHGHTPIHDIAGVSAGWRYQCQDNASLDRDNNHVRVSHVPAAVNIGTFHNHDILGLYPFDQQPNLSAFNPMMHLGSPSLQPDLSLVYGTDLRYQRPSPCGYGAVTDLRSEQQLLLQYLKEREWRLQQESQLRGPT